MSKKKRRSTEELLATPLFAGVLLPMVYAIYRLFVTTIERLEPRHAYMIARALGWLGWLLAPRMRKTALRNLEIAFREQYDDKERRRIGRLSVQHFICTLFDVYLLPARYAQGDWLGCVELSADQRAQFAAFRADVRGVAFQSAHIGSWEVASGMATSLGKPILMVYRPLVIKSIDEDFARYRATIGARPVSKEGAMRAIARTLRDSGWFAILSDQNAGEYAPYLSFFGIPVTAQIEHFMTYQRFDARIATGFMIRDGFNFRFKFHGLWEERFDPDAEPVAESYRLGQWYLNLVEQVAREHPEQYLWLHRRYARRPKGGQELYNDLGKPLDMSALANQPPTPIHPKED